MINEILEVSKQAPYKHPYSVLAKLMEEVGELAQEVNIKLGFIDKPEGKDGIIGEGSDIINCIIDIMQLFHPNITREQIEEMNNKKLDKWKSHFS